VKVGNPDPQFRYERHALKKRVDVTTSSGETFSAETRDVSRSGMAVSLSTPVMENGQFLELHAEGLGEVTGRVARTYDGGAAIQFEKLLQEDPQGDRPISKLNTLA